MKRVFGLETEYGITLSGADSVDVVAESIELVRQLHRARRPHEMGLRSGGSTSGCARVSRAANFFRTPTNRPTTRSTRRRPLSFEEIKSDLVLSNGARFYNDHAHPEYSTPECTTLREIVAQDKAGERILQNARGAGIRSCRQVTKFVSTRTTPTSSGHSYGCHDNYLLVAPFRGTRSSQVFCRFSSLDRFLPAREKWVWRRRAAKEQAGIYQISQRADFFSVLASIDTMNRRPLINTRDEPHVDASRYRRFHVILGDSNMSEWSTAMKIGTTATGPGTRSSAEKRLTSRLRNQLTPTNQSVATKPTIGSSN